MRFRGSFSNCFMVLVIDFLLLSSDALANGYYQLDVVAKKGDLDSYNRPIMEIYPSVSVNDNGYVTFTGVTMSDPMDFGLSGPRRENIFVTNARNPSAPWPLLTPAAGLFELQAEGTGPRQYFGVPRINNQNLVQAVRHIYPTMLFNLQCCLEGFFSYLEQWNALGTFGATYNLVGCGNADEELKYTMFAVPIHGLYLPSPYAFGSSWNGFPVSSSKKIAFHSTNNMGMSVFSAAKPGWQWSLGTPVGSGVYSIYNDFPVTGPPILPSISDEGSIVATSERGNASPLFLFPYDLSAAAEIAGTNDFSFIGEKPAISDDGRIIVFYGILTEQGAANINAHMRNFPTDLKLDPLYAGPGLFAAIRYPFDAGVNISMNSNRIYLRIPGTDLVASDTDIGIGNAGEIADTLEGIKRTGRRYTIVATGIPVFGQRKSILTSYLTYTLIERTDGTRTHRFSAGSPQCVATVGEEISGVPGRLTDVHIYDPTMTDDEIVFWCSTDANSQAIIKAKTRVELRSLEINQAIQDWRNSIPLVQGKATYVRAFLQSPSGTINNLDASKAILNIFKQGILVQQVSPDSMNTDKYIDIPIDATDETIRSDRLKSINFKVDTSKFIGRTTFEFNLDGISCIEPEISDEPPLGDCIIARDFIQIPRPTILMYKADVRPTSYTYPTPSTNDMRYVWNRINAILPVAPEELPSVGNHPISQDDFCHTRRNKGFPDSTCLNMYALLDHFDKSRQHSFSNPLFLLFLIKGEPPAWQSVYGSALPSVTEAPGGSGYCYINPGQFGQFGYYRNAPVHELIHTFGKLEGGFRFGHPAEPFAIEGFCGEKAPLETGFAEFLFSNGKQEIPGIGPGLDWADTDDVIYGLDSLWMEGQPLFEVVDPAIHPEIMSYCGMPEFWNNAPTNGYYGWISKKTYRDLIERFRQLDISPLTSYYSSSNPIEDMLIIMGYIDTNNETATIFPIERALIGDYQFQASGGQYDLTLEDEAGVKINTVSFDVLIHEDSEPIFMIPIVTDARIHKIAISRNDQVLGSIMASQNSPTVEVVSPNGNEIISGEEFYIKWHGQDQDEDNLFYNISFSADGGQTWNEVAYGWPYEELSLNLSDFPKTNEGLIKIAATDGFNTGFDVSDSFFTIDETTATCMANLDRDFDVDGLDLSLLSTEFNRTGCTSKTCKGDLNRDGTVSAEDLHLFSTQFGIEFCPTVWFDE